MKTKTSRKSKVLASSLLTVLFIGTLLSLGALSYLTLVDQQSYLSYRSQAWNLAMTLVEAGLEDGLEQLNSNGANLGAAPWSYNTNASTYSHTYTSSAGSYTVYIQFYDPFAPLVQCKATVTEPTLVQYSPAAFFAAGGVNTPQTGGSVSRAVQIRAVRGNLLIKGMVARQSIDMNGNDIMTDSFDSTDPAHSANGMYPSGDATKLKSNGDVAVNASVTNAVNGGNANIYGHVMVGPGGTVAVGPNGGVGDYSWQPGHSGQMESGYVTDNANFTFPDQVLPYNAASPGVKFPTSGTIGVTNYVPATNTVTSSTYPNPVPYGGVITNSVTVNTGKNWPNEPGTTTNCDGTTYTDKNFPTVDYCPNPPPWQTGNGNNNNSAWNWYGISGYSYVSNSYTYNLYTTNNTVSSSTYYDYVLYDGDYYLGTTLSGNILVLGNARLVLPNGIQMAGNDKLTIAQTGSLQMFVDKNSSIGGNGVVNNNGFAINCEMFCTPKVNTLNFTGNGTFTGVIVAPEANVSMNGGGHSNNDFMGALMANSVKMNGKYSFHYDEALSKNAAKSRYIVKSWDEISPDSF